MRGKWNWRRVLLSGLALLVALSAALTAEVRTSRAATTTRAAAPTIVLGSSRSGVRFLPCAEVYATNDDCGSAFKPARRIEANS